MTKMTWQSRLAALLFLLGITLVTGPGHAQDIETAVLKWTPEPGIKYYFNLEITGSPLGEELDRRTEIVVECLSGSSIMESGPQRFDFRVEPMDGHANDPLSTRFDYAQFDETSFTVMPNGLMLVGGYQLFPTLLNVPAFPDVPVGLGMSWSGGPLDIIPQRNFGSIPFTFVSTYDSTREYMHDNCAVIETTYEVALPENTEVLSPFLGLIETEGEEYHPGEGALVGNVVQDSAAHKAGILPGDYVVEIAGETIRGWEGLREISQYLVPGHPVDIRYNREGVNNTVQITPDGIPSGTVSGSGGAHSTVFFSLDSGIPYKIEFETENLILTFDTEEGDPVSYVADRTWVLEFVRRSTPSAG